jgi:hypothetical protein
LVKKTKKINEKKKIKERRGVGGKKRGVGEEGKGGSSSQVFSL